MEIILLLLVDLVFVFIWIKVVNKLDSHQIDKQTTKMTLRFYFGGLLSYPLIAFLYEFLPLPDYGGIGYHFIAVGPIEEISKFSVFIFLMMSQNSIREPRDGILQAATVGLAYASIENLGYGALYGPGVLIYRSIFTTPGHMVYAAIWGFYTVYVIYDQQEVKGRRKWRIAFAAVFIVSMIHGLFNSLVDLGVPEFALLLDIGSLTIACVMYAVFVKHSPYKPLPLKDYKTNIQLLKRALQSSPRSPILNLRLAQNYIRAGMPDKARSCVTTAMKSNNSPYLVYYKGVCFILDGEIEKGQELVGKALPQLSLNARLTLRRKLRDMIPPEEREPAFRAIRVVERVNDGFVHPRYHAAKYWGT